MRVYAIFAGLVLAVLCAFAVTAEEPARGPVTNLPLPRFVSMKASEANVRRGPSQEHRIDWVFHRRFMPLEVTAEYGHWRRVRDIDGAGGWVHYSLLSGVRHVIVLEDVELLSRLRLPRETVAHVEAGVVAKLGNCVPEWCEVTAERYKGWVEKARLWGVNPGEIRD